MGDSTLSLLQGTLDVLVLKALEGSPRHGYGVGQWIREVSDGDLLIEEGALYTALHRMERRRWLSSTWGSSESGRRAKFYRLTSAGKRQLGRQTRLWSRYAGAMFKVLGARGAGA